MTLFTPTPALTLHPGIAKVYEMFFTPQKVEVSEADVAFLGAATQIAVPYDGIDLIVSSWGEGPTVLLVHGWGGSRTQMRGFVPPLVEAGFRVVAFDFPAHGDTQGQTTNILEMSPALKTIEAYEGPFHAIIAHSFGTLITSYTLANHREISLSRLVYFGAMNRLMDSVPRFQKLAGLTDEIITNLTWAIEENFGKELLASIANESLAPQLDIPALMFHDEQDPITPVEDSLEIARAWPAAELIITKGLGHRRALRDEQIIRKVVAFIQEGAGE
jgi:pimeloyl-ACP methyl ester carboxylesterase